jgi:hypothetical protein
MNIHMSITREVSMHTCTSRNLFAFLIGLAIIAGVMRLFL